MGRIQLKERCALYCFHGFRAPMRGKVLATATSGYGGAISESIKCRLRLRLIRTVTTVSRLTIFTDHCHPSALMRGFLGLGFDC